jgi:hypothetical protein
MGLIALNDRINVRDELEKCGKKQSSMSYVKILTQNSGLWELRKTTNHLRIVSIQAKIRTQTSQHKAGALTTQPQCTVYKTNVVSNSNYNQIIATSMKIMMIQAQN